MLDAQVEMEKSSKSIVYFEDDKDMVELVRIILSRADFLVEGVGEGQSGINLVKRTQPDVVLLDLMLPDMDGWEIFQQLKKDEATKSIPVIIVTAKSQSVDKVLGIEIDQVDEYITKPFRPDELIERVNSVLIHKKP
jgi:DNA-binding response OmpR family regulator